ncbi:phage tail termination protein, partial [Pasteurella multocida]
MNLLNVFKSHVISSNLFSLFQVQLHQWKDNGDKKSEYIVFQNNGGTPIRDGLSSESYIIISIIGSAQSGYSV